MPLFIQIQETQPFQNRKLVKKKKIVLEISCILPNSSADWFVIVRNSKADLGYLNYYENLF